MGIIFSYMVKMFGYSNLLFDISRIKDQLKGRQSKYELQNRPTENLSTPARGYGVSGT